MKKILITLLILTTIVTYSTAQFHAGMLVYSTNASSLQNDFEDKHSLDVGVLLSFRPKQKNWTYYRFDLSITQIQRKAVVSQINYIGNYTKFGFDFSFLHDMELLKAYFNIGLGGYYSKPANTNLEIQGYDIDAAHFGVNAKMGLNFGLTHGGRAEIGILYGIDIFSNTGTRLETISFKDAGIYVGIHSSLNAVYNRLFKKYKKKETNN